MLCCSPQEWREREFGGFPLCDYDSRMGSGVNERGRADRQVVYGEKPKEKAMVREVRTLLQICFEATSNKILQQLVSRACAFTVCSGGNSLILLVGEEARIHAAEAT